MLKTSFFLISLFIFVFTIFFTYTYKVLAIKKGIFANVNNRSLHHNDTPSGGGIVFSLIFIFSVILLWYYQYLNNKIILFICYGGVVGSLFGFFDDIFDLKAILKFIVQIILGIWILYILSGGPLYYVSWIPETLDWITLFITLFILVWIMNIFNFVDGIDGLAVSGTIFICWVLAGFIYFFGEGYENAFILFLLGTVCLGFLLFNFPPASIFMGDSGSLFLGYIIGVLFLKTIMEGDINIWTWCIVLGYFITDTTATTLSRIIMGTKWYGEHRSHAYQNLARLWNSHLKVTISIIIFHLIWLLPLAFLSVLKPIIGPILFLIGTIPTIIFNYLLGPTYSKN